MNALPRSLKLLAAGALALSLGACVTVFPKDKPAQLYRFDGASPAAEAGAAASAQFGVARAGGGFAQAASGDRLLTMTGSRAAYIADSRWVSPAQVLFNEALARAFDGNTGAARLLGRGEVGKADYTLRVDVTRFETVYDHGNGAPNIVVDLRATLTSADRSVTNTRQVNAEVRAGSNRVSSIVEAYDQAVGKALGELVAWTNGRGA